MSFTAPRFMVGNPIAEGMLEPASNIIGLNNSVAYPITFAGKRALIDYKKSPVCFWGNSGGDSGFSVALPASFSSDILNIALIPAGHLNLGSSKIWEVRHDDSNLFPSSTLVYSGSQSSGIDSSIYVMELSTTVAERFWSFTTTHVTGTFFSIGDFWLGKRYTLSDSALIDPIWDNGYESQIVETPYPGGTATTELGPPRRRFSLSVRNVIPGSADSDVLELVATKGRANVFWYWPPDDTDPGPFLVQLEEDMIISQDHPVPNVETRYKYRLQMLESLL